MVLGTVLNGGKARGCCSLSVEGGVKLEVREAAEAVGLSSNKDWSVLRIEDVRVSGGDE
jgi:hypothetical protein